MITILCARVVVLAVCATTIAAVVGCAGPFGPSCREEVQRIRDETSRVEAGTVATSTVRSPKSSNLVMVLTWPDQSARLQLRATIIDCGGHTGCQMLGINGLKMPNGDVRLLVDGWEGKTYRVEVTGDEVKDADYRLLITYEIQCES